MNPFSLILARVLLIAISLVLWFWTQRLLARRKPLPDASPIFDGLHELTAPINRRLLAHPARAGALLIISSAIIDAVGIFLLLSAILGPSIAPFLGLFILFALRQLCQAFCPLPPPLGMIWHNPGFPALLVTYETTSDLFFSGHTAIAVFAAATFASFGPLGLTLGIAIALFEITAVLLLRAHYTIDVFTGALAALYVHHLASQCAPAVDALLTHAAAFAAHMT